MQTLRCPLGKVIHLNREVHNDANNETRIKFRKNERGEYDKFEKRHHSGRICTC